LKNLTAIHFGRRKDMKFPIDIIWLDSDGKVVCIRENMQSLYHNYCLHFVYTKYWYVLDNANLFWRLVIFDVGRNAKFNCGKMATQVALFNVDGAMIIEKYCDKCAKKIVK
jgi:hypothetical protein